MSANSDWRSPKKDSYLKRLDRAGFAWELLRRSRAYRNDYKSIVRGGASDAEFGGATNEALVRRWGLSFRG